MILLRENRRVNIWDSRWLGVRYTPHPEERGFLEWHLLYLPVHHPDS
jgi:hypothetical protein